MRIAVLLAVLGVARAASAHQSSIKYVDITLDDAGAAVVVRVSPADVTEPLGLRPDARPTALQAAQNPRVALYVARWIAISGGGAPCMTTTPGAQPDEDGKFLVVTFHAACERAADRADFAAFFALDRRHVAIVHLVAPGAEPVDRMVRATTPVLSLELPLPPGAATRAGMRGGFSDAAFVVALLIVVVLARGRSGWTVRAFVPAVRAGALVLAAFAIGEAVGLAASALHWVALAPRLCDALVALSLIYVAGDDVVRPDARGRHAVALGFGVAHGLWLGAAAAAPGGWFGLGAGLGEVAVASLALPIVYGAARRIGADRYRRLAVLGLGLVLIALGLLGMIGALLGVAVLGR
ncbi:MAG TPA: HupE/UreJ family protein [Kofleriaceae bacterium]|nr:HupE/UreJ family protein [Kofleriaceae bacterium]